MKNYVYIVTDRGFEGEKDLCAVFDNPREAVYLKHRLMKLNRSIIGADGKVHMLDYIEIERHEVNHSGDVLYGRVN